MSLDPPSGLVARARASIAHRMRRRTGANRVSWVAAQEQPESPRPLEHFRLFGIIGAFTEEDVIGATVANAFAQGCEEVYLVDNDSRDDTVGAAIAAGAQLAASFATERYDEVLRMSVMNRVVAERSAADGSDHIWWLWIDADEFPQGPRGLTVREYLASLDRAYRIVGGRFVNHFPDRRPAHLHGFHPLEFQPLCEEHFASVCGLRHRKHPLQRFDRGRPAIECGRGFHAASSEERPLLEPTEAIYVHHFPYRDPEVTRRRLAILCATDESGATRVVDGDDAADGMVPRFQTLDAVYAGDWAQVRNYRFEGDHSTAQPVPWSTIARPDELAITRWYDAADLDAAMRAYDAHEAESAS